MASGFRYIEFAAGIHNKNNGIMTGLTINALRSHQFLFVAWRQRNKRNPFLYRLIITPVCHNYANNTGNFTAPLNTTFHYS